MTCFSIIIMILFKSKLSNYIFFMIVDEIYIICYDSSLNNR